jgi:DNA repair ATPase RecN
MNKKMLLQKSLLVALAAALVVAAFPLTGVSAASAPAQGPTNERLENTWQRMLKGYERLTNLSEKSDDLFARADKMIERLKSLGVDTAEVETALADFEAAVKEAKPILESCKGIVNSHKGFDDNGKVTDRAQAIQTVGDMGSKLQEIRNLLEDKGKTLAELVKSLREQILPSAAATPSAPDER